MHKKLRKLREEKRVSQEEMGRLLSISQPQYQRKETGFAPFTEDECQIIADYFNLPMDEIMEADSITQYNHKQQGGIAQVIYYIADKLIDEVKEMNSFLKEELLAKKEENRKLKEQLNVLQHEGKKKDPN